MPAFSCGRRWRGLPRRMRCYYNILPKHPHVAMFTPILSPKLKHHVSATPTEFASQIGQFPPYDRAKVPSTAKTRNQIFHPLFLLQKQAQKKKLSKRKAPMKSFRTLRSATRATCPCPSRLLKKAGENFWVAGENFNYGALKLHYSARKL